MTAWEIHRTKVFVRQLKKHRSQHTMLQELTKVLRRLQTDPYLDAAIFETWFNPKNSGQNFLKTIQRIYDKIFVEEIKSEHFEKTVYMAHLGLMKQLINYSCLPLPQFSIVSAQILARECCNHILQKNVIL